MVVITKRPTGVNCGSIALQRPLANLEEDIFISHNFRVNLPPYDIFESNATKKTRVMSAWKEGLS